MPPTTAPSQPPKASAAKVPAAKVPAAKAPRDRPAHVQHFIDQHLDAARDVQRKWRVPVAVTLCQAALESGWGRHVKGNAYFGVKGRAGAGPTVAFGTTEYVGGQKVSVTDAFRAYASFAEAADGYGEFLSTNPRYREAFEHVDDPVAFAREVARAGYATDPDYEAKLLATMRSQRLLELAP